MSNEHIRTATLRASEILTSGDYVPTHGDLSTETLTQAVAFAIVDLMHLSCCSDLSLKGVFRLALDIYKEETTNDDDNNNTCNFDSHVNDLFQLKGS